MKAPAGADNPIPQYEDFAPHWMLMPALACPAQCAYCFGPNRGPLMNEAVLEAAVDWMDSITPAEKPVSVTFHGGEPLLAGTAWYRRALPLLQARFGERLSLHAQSNLWLLDEAFCDLLAEYRVSLGTSLDGPEEINDAQRGAGYYAGTMRGIEIARRRGLSVGAICTFTRRSAPTWREVFDFFLREELPVTFHGAVRAASRSTEDELSLTPEEYGDLSVRLFDHYLENIRHTRISTFDQMARGIATGACGLCTFTGCLGRYLAIGPEGGIFPCNRYAHHAEWRVGSVQARPTLADLRASAPWQALQARQERVRVECAGCPHFAYCKGGCPYNAVEQGHSQASARDRYCPAYRRIFDHISGRALAEVFSEQNLEAVVENGSGPHGLLRKGPLLQIMRGGTHPARNTAQAWETAAAAALGASASLEQALDALAQKGLAANRRAAEERLRRLDQRLHPDRPALLNAYLHITYACNQRCPHCYAEGSPARKAESLPVADARRLIPLLAEAGYRKIIITGGEPLAHPQAGELLAALAELREQIRPAKIVLRSNLSMGLSGGALSALAAAADQIVVSMDGDQETHDRRRGHGAYAQTVANLRALASLLPPERIALTAVLAGEERRGAPGDAVRALAAELGIRARFKPLLPLGRAAASRVQREYERALDEDADGTEMACRPTATCGLGMHLSIAPNGRCSPCHALSGPRHTLGSLLGNDPAGVLARARAYSACTVDSNQKCRACDLRYLCGGFCRAWSSSADPDAPPADCSALYARAAARLSAALEVLAF